MDISSLPKPVNPTIWIGKKETASDLLGAKPGGVKYLCVYSDNKKADLGFLKEYPNVETLFINGDFASVDGISELKRLNRLILVLSSDADLSGVCVPELKSLTVYHRINNGFTELLTDKLEYLALLEMRKLADLSFIEKAAGLKKLYLMSLPAVEKLPDFGKMPDLYGLKVYELHKLNDVESLTRSNIKYLALTLAADKLSGTKIADVLLRMEKLEGADILLDRSGTGRVKVLENQLKKAGRSELLNMDMSMARWKLL